MEKNELYPKSIELNKNLLAENIKLFKWNKNEKLKEIQNRNIAFIATGLKLLGSEPENLPEEAKKIYEEEIKKQAQKKLLLQL